MVRNRSASTIWRATAPVLAVHGGAGHIVPEEFSTQRVAAARLGAGTWADDRSCAISATGDGEALILSVFAHEVDALVRLAGLSLGAACQRALHEVEVRTGTGGCIAVGADGTVAMPFTSVGMFRGSVDATGVHRIGVFAKDLNEC